MYSSFVPLGKFMSVIPRHLILFVAMVNGVDSLISLSYFSLLVYRNTSDFCYWFCILQLLKIHWLALVIFWYYLCSFLCTVSCHLQTVRALFFLFQSGFLLFLFYSLIAVARNSRTMLNNSGESGCPCLVLDLRGNAFSFSPLKIIFAVGLPYMAFTILR